jgi:hypothetical protein
MVNPNPARITDALWRLWTDRPNTSWRLGGIYADKRYYHNTVIANKLHWPGNYSIRFPLDLVNKNQDKARAIDVTMSDSEMVKWTRRMKNAAENPKDTRLYAVREFYGTLDNKTVFGMIKDSATGRWRYATADKTHLWHGHMGIFTAFVHDWDKLSPILSVWRGEEFEDWVDVDLPRSGDIGEHVKYWQYTHNRVRSTVNPPSPSVVVDGDYGKTTQAAFADFWKKRGGKGTFTGSLMTGWLALQYQEALIIKNMPKPGPIVTPPPIPDAEIASFLNKWFDSRFAGRKMKVTGDLSGEVQL